ncbi:MAG: DUF721 domain-containing protein [Proteobacteria bacterium]|nr:DUF721 domain-containing protein [Pseudomonadota bacterium]MDE3208166.1 DUF721 domain-containing protein [Pseudomonadota bacterium]
MRPFKFYIDSDSEPESVLKKAQFLSNLDQVWKEIAPGRLQPIRVSHIKDNELFLISPNGYLATYARHQAPSILEAFMIKGYRFKNMVVIVRPNQDISQRRSKTRGNIPEKALVAIDALNNTLKEGELKSALTRLLKQHKKH